MQNLVALLILGLTVTGCSKSSSTASDAAKKGSPGASSAERHATAPLAQNPRDINALFQNEAVNRPKGGVTAENALSAFKRAGIEIKEERQHLGRPYGARYCVGAFASGKDVALSVCEYIDTSAAESGAANSRKLRLENREIRINRATSLTTRELKKSSETDAVVARLFESFAKL